MMKKNHAARLGALALSLTLVSTCLMGGTLAKYTTTVTGTATATVAKWVFNAYDATDNTKQFNVKLTDTALNGKVTADKFYVERATAEATLEFIKGDIQKSENNYADITVTNSYDKTIWSKAATLMLKAEIYMWAYRTYCYRNN